MPAFPLYYQVLGIEKQASTQQIRDAYRRESLKCVRYGCTRGVC